MKKVLMIVLVIAHVSAMAQQEKPVESSIKNVTVFLNKAQVSRLIKTKLESGKTNLIVTGLTSQLDPQSIQVAGKGNFVILGISHRQNYLTESNTPKSLKILKDSIEHYQQRLLLENNQKEILNKEEQMLLSNQRIGGTNQNLTVAELKSMADFFRSRLGEIVTSRMKQDEKIKKINERLLKLQAQVNEQSNSLSQNTSEILISVSAEANVTAEFDLDYIVANAGWSAVYDLRAINTKNPIQLNYKANVYQQTGEEWKNVKLKLSTANPNQGGLKPELYTWNLNLYEPYQDSRALYGKASGAKPYRKDKDAPSAPSIQYEEVESVAAPAEVAADYVSTIQTTLSTEFDIALPYTITSGGKPTTVDIQNHEMKAEYAYAVAPKLDLDAFLMARAIGWEEFNLLPGEANIFFEGTFVGKTYIDPNNIKDTLAISLGRDKRIVVKREKLKDFTSKKLIGTNKRDSYAYEISLRNTKTEAVKITVEDQVPVSQNSQIEISITDIGGARHAQDKGKLTWDFTLKPNETKKMVYKFEVKYPKEKTIANLD